MALYGKKGEPFTWLDGKSYYQSDDGKGYVPNYDDKSHHDIAYRFGIRPKSPMTSLPGQQFLSGSIGTSVDPVAASSKAFSASVDQPSWFQPKSSQAASGVSNMPGMPAAPSAPSGPFAFLSQQQNASPQNGLPQPQSPRPTSAAPSTASMPGMGRGTFGNIPLLSGGVRR